MMNLLIKVDGDSGRITCEWGCMRDHRCDQQSQDGKECDLFNVVLEETIDRDGLHYRCHACSHAQSLARECGVDCDD